MKIPKLLLSITFALGVLFSVGCADLNKEVTIKTTTGYKKVLNIKAPRKYSKDKEAYFVCYTIFYMTAWNQGVQESENWDYGYLFDVNAYSKSRIGTIQSDMDAVEEIGEYLEKQKDLEEKIKAEGRDFVNKQKK